MNVSSWIPVISMWKKNKKQANRSFSRAHGSRPASRALPKHPVERFLLWERKECVKSPAVKGMSNCGQGPANEIKVGGNSELQSFRLTWTFEQKWKDLVRYAAVCSESCLMYNWRSLHRMFGGDGLDFGGVWYIWVLSELEPLRR